MKEVSGLRWWYFNDILSKILPVVQGPLCWKSKISNYDDPDKSASSWQWKAFPLSFHLIIAYFDASFADHNKNQAQ